MRHKSLQKGQGTRPEGERQKWRSSCDYRQKLGGNCKYWAEGKELVSSEVSKINVSPHCFSKIDFGSL